MYHTFRSILGYGLKHLRTKIGFVPEGSDVMNFPAFKGFMRMPVIGRNMLHHFVASEWLGWPAPRTIEKHKLQHKKHIKQTSQNMLNKSTNILKCFSTEMGNEVGWREGKNFVESYDPSEVALKLGRWATYHHTILLRQGAVSVRYTPGCGDHWGGDGKEVGDEHEMRINHMISMIKIDHLDHKESSLIIVTMLNDHGGASWMNHYDHMQWTFAWACTVELRWKSNKSLHESWVVIVLCLSLLCYKYLHALLCSASSWSSWFAGTCF